MKKYVGINTSFDDNEFENFDEYEFLEQVCLCLIMMRLL